MKDTGTIHARAAWGPMLEQIQGLGFLSVSVCMISSNSRNSSRVRIMFDSRNSSILRSFLFLSLVKFASTTLPECKSLKEDLPDGIYEHAVDMRKDLSVLGMVLDELMPFGHPFEVETVLTKSRNLLLNNDWEKVYTRHYLERLKVKENKSEQGDFPLAAAINLFHSMRECLYKCDYTSSLSLAANYIAVFEKELYPTDDDRVKWAILEMAKLHGEKCLPNYLHEFRGAQSTLESDLMKKLDTAFDADLLDRILMGKDVKDLSSAYLNDMLLQRRAELFDRVQTLAKDTEEAKYISAKRSGVGRHDFEVHPNFKTKTVTKHLIEPCRKFVRLFRDIFYPMRMDLIFIDGSTLEPMEASGSADLLKDKELVDWWLKYRLCRELSNDRSRFVDLIAGELPSKLGLIAPEEPTTISPTTSSTV